MSTTALYCLPPEVFREICEWLLHGVEMPESPPQTAEEYMPLVIGVRTTAALAQTARLFYEPCMAAMWHTMPDIAVLFYTLPRECYRRARVRDHLSWVMFSFDRPLGEIDFSRFRSHAARVKVLQRTTPGFHLPLRTRRYIIKPPALVELEAYSQANGCVHVKLYDPVVGLPKYDDYPRAADHVDFEEDAVHILTRLQKLCPNLQQFGMYADPSSVHIGSVVMDACLSFKNLTSFDCGGTTLPLSFKAFTYLASLPNLQQLKFATDRKSWSFDDFWLLDHKPKDKIFPALRDLRMTTLTIRLAMKMLPYIHSRRLRHIEVKVIHAILRKQVLPLVYVICCLRGQYRLEHVELSLDVIRSDGDKSQPPEPIRGKTIIPFFSLISLRRLHLDIYCPWDIDDDSLKQVALSCPCLTTLELGVDRPWPTDVLTRPLPRVTFIGLMWVALMCPRLETLGIEWHPDVDSAQKDRGAMMPIVFTRESALTKLRVGFSRLPERDTLATTSLLSNFFPDLRTVESAWGARRRAEMREAQQIRERLEKDGGVYVPDPEQAERCKAYGNHGSQWTLVGQTVPEWSLIRGQERDWNEQHGKYDRVSYVQLFGEDALHLGVTPGTWAAAIEPAESESS
ncbi:hypothetical protein C8Q80DRAFT_394500 [Daedaleopsis nitida]|nr:hypothetical protein C8Q80DRAFT_394500 [Daedaleopsis nitida]